MAAAPHRDVGALGKASGEVRSQAEPGNEATGRTRKPLPPGVRYSVNARMANAVAASRMNLPMLSCGLRGRLG
jgi:hypothetical protein